MAEKQLPHDLPRNTPTLQHSNSSLLHPHSSLLSIRIWERGAGETQGCGTGSSAAAVVYCRSRGKGGTIDVRNPGGIVKVTMDNWSAPITTEAEAQIVFAGELHASQ